MGLQTSIENVSRTEDGPYPCYDAVDGGTRHLPAL